MQHIRIEERPWWQVWKRPDPEPAADGFTIFGMPWEALAQTAAFLLVIGLLLVYRRRLMMEIFGGMFSELLAWVVAIFLMIVAMTVFIFFTEGASVLVALVMAVIVVAIVIIGSVWS